MGRKKVPGLYKRYGVWQIDKTIFGQRIHGSTGTSNLEEAEKMLAYKTEEIRKVAFYGDRPKRTFLAAATKFLKENQHKASIRNDAREIQLLVPYIGELSLDLIHFGSFQKFIEDRKKSGVKMRTINYALQVARRILNLAANEWIDESGLTWIKSAPRIKLLKETDKRKPYPLSWEEQDRLLTELPIHLQNMVLFAVNTGCREKVIRTLKWEWEQYIPQLNTSVFVVPGYVSLSHNETQRNVKNGEDRIIVLNKVANHVIEKVQGQHRKYVFTYHGRPIKTSFNNSAWQQVTKRTGIPVRVHDLKHTFGRRLRSAGVSYEDRQDLLGHKSGRITTHYSAAELENLIIAANKACDRSQSGVLLRVTGKNPLVSRESPVQQLRVVR